MANDCWGPAVHSTEDLPKAECTHDDGRVCVLKEGRWWIRFHENVLPGDDMRSEERAKVECVRLHGIATRPSDRGEFGFPHPGSSLGAMVYKSDPLREDIPDRIGAFRENDKVSRVCNIMDEAQTLYRRKAGGYKTVDGDTANVLGAKGQFADINRKFWKLKGMLWDETIEPYPDAGNGESVEEVLMDFIGHAALTIDFLRQSQGEKEEGR